MSTERVWVVSVDTHHGMSVSLWRKQEDAVDALYEYVAMHWDYLYGGPEDPGKDKLPEDKWAAIEKYFDDKHEDTYKIQLMTIN